MKSLKATFNSKCDSIGTGPMCNTSGYLGREEVNNCYFIYIIHLFSPDIGPDFT